MNAVLDRLRGREDLPEGDAVPLGAQACAALWERAGSAVVRALVGEAVRIVEFLRQLPSPRPLADALLAAGSPADLCGADAAPDTVDACLAELRSKATPARWRVWVKRWAADAHLAAGSQDAQPWWRRWWR